MRKSFSFKRVFTSFYLVPALFLLFGNNAFSQNNFPQGCFIPPVSIPMFLSGSFSELRNSHFHGGIDIRTESRVGLPIVAIADGHISKISILGSSYGKMLFLQHDNGYTSVYAHLSGFEGKLSAWIKEMQYRQESFEVELEPPANKFFYKQGDTIAFSGNTGASLAPHLHFEIRETASDWTINPLLFGFQIEDKLSPLITGVRLYPVGTKSAIQYVSVGKSGTYTKDFFSPTDLGLYKSGNIWTSYAKLVKVKGKMGVGVECKDYMNGTGNVFDIYSIDLYADDKLIFTEKRNAFSLQDTRYINALRDFDAKYRSGRQFQRLFLLPNNKLAFYENVTDRGLISVAKGDTIPIRIEAKDYHGNMSVVKFYVSSSDLDDAVIPVKVDTNYQKLFRYDQPNYFSENGIELIFMENSFYEDLKFHYKKRAGNRSSFSPVYTIHDPVVPIQTSYTMRIIPEKLPERLYSKAFIAQVNGESGYRYTGGEYKDGYVEAKVKNFGNFTVIVDTIAPVIHPLNFVNGSSLRYLTELKVSIYDNLSGIGTYKAYLDGDWILMEYDQKKNLLTCKIDKDLSPGEHSFKLIVNDKKKNEKELNIILKK